MRQLGDVRCDPARLVVGQALSRCDGNLGAVSPQKEPQAEYATRLGLGLQALGGTLRGSNCRPALA